MIDTTNRNTALASAFAEELARSGVEHAVVSPGSRSTPLAVALDRQAGIEVSVVIDERSAGFIALGAAQATGRPVALLCTSGTAAANYLPAVVEADLSGVPLIVLTADRPPELRGIGAGQVIDQLKLYGSAVRWFCEVGTHDADDDGLIYHRSIACRAFAASRGDRRSGPVHLNFGWREPLAPAPARDQVTATGDLALNGRVSEPMTTVDRGAIGPDNAAVERLAAAIEASPNGVILAGRQTDPRLRSPLATLAKRAGYPILAEPTSQLRCGPHDRANVITSYDAIFGTAVADEIQPDLILRFGELPTSKRLREWLASRTGARHVVVDPTDAWNEPTRIANEIVRADPVGLCERLTGEIDDRGKTDHLEHWLGYERRETDDLKGLVADEPGLSAAGLHRALAGAYTDGQIVYTNSSLPIREQEAWLPSVEADVTFLANRGANGIDGLISSGIGAALASGRPTTVITGDVAFLHDLGALASIGLAQAAVRIVLVNNGGGAIFDRLPQKEAMTADEFSRLMTTAPGIDPADAANLFGLPHTRLEDLSQLVPALTAGSCLIEVPVPT